MAQPEKSNEGGENPVGDRIRQARQDAKLSLDAIGKELGVTGSAVSQWESGRTWPTWARLVRFAKLTGVTIQWLLVGEGDDGLGYRPMTIPRVTPTEAIDPKLDRSAIKKVGRPLEDFVIPNFPCSTSALAVPVFDLRNAPLYELGDIVLIDPEVRPVPGDMVLAAIDPDPVAVFAKYVLGRSLRSQDAQLARAQYHEAKANMQNKPEFMQILENKRSLMGSRAADASIAEFWKEVEARIYASHSLVSLVPLNPDWDAVSLGSDKVIGVMTEHIKPRRRTGL